MVTSDEFKRMMASPNEWKSFRKLNSSLYFKDLDIHPEKNEHFIFFQKIDLSKIELNKCSINSIIFIGCDLSESIFELTDFSKCFFFDCTIIASKFRQFSFDKFCRFVNCRLNHSGFFDGSASYVANENTTYRTNWENVEISGEGIDDFYQIMAFHESSFIMCTFHNARSGVDFQGCYINDSKFSDCHTEGAKFHESIISGAVFRNCSLKESDFTHTRIVNSDLSDTNLDESNFSFSVISGGKFEKIKGMDFSNSSLCNSTFSNASISRTKFDSAELSNVVFIDSTFVGVSFNNSSMINAKLNRLDIRDVDFSFVDFCGSVIGDIRGLRRKDFQNITIDSETKMDTDFRMMASEIGFENITRRCQIYFGPIDKLASDVRYGQSIRLSNHDFIKFETADNIIKSVRVFYARILNLPSNKRYNILATGVRQDLNDIEELLKDLINKIDSDDYIICKRHFVKHPSFSVEGEKSIIRGGDLYRNNNSLTIALHRMGYGIYQIQDPNGS